MDDYSWKEEYYNRKYGSDLDEYSYYEDDYSYYESEEPEDSDDSYDRWLWEINWSEPEAEPTPEEELELNLRLLSREDKLLLLEISSRLLSGSKSVTSSQEHLKNWRFFHS